MLPVRSPWFIAAEQLQLSLMFLFNSTRGNFRRSFQACVLAGFAITALVFRELLSKHSFPGGAVVMNPPAEAGDARDSGSVPGSGRSPGEGNGSPPQYSCLGNPMNRGAWQVIVCGVIRVSHDLSTEHACPVTTAITGRNSAVSLFSLKYEAGSLFLHNTSETKCKLIMKLAKRAEQNGTTPVMYRLRCIFSRSTLLLTRPFQGQTAVYPSL